MVQHEQIGKILLQDSYFNLLYSDENVVLIRERNLAAIRAGLDVYERLANVRNPDRPSIVSHAQNI